MTIQPPEPPRCSHEHVQLRRRTNRGGAVSAAKQCLRCGTSTAGIAKADLRVPIGSLPVWDEGLVGSWRKLCEDYHAEWKIWSSTHRQVENDSWWKQYKEHLKSDKWKEIRRKVFTRCRGICEGCGERNADQVHHLTYQRLGNEMLFDLAAVCTTCHEAIHPHMKEDSPEPSPDRPQSAPVPAQEFSPEQFSCCCCPSKAVAFCSAPAALSDSKLVWSSMSYSEIKAIPTTCSRPICERHKNDAGSGRAWCVLCLSVYQARYGGKPGD